MKATFPSLGIYNEVIKEMLEELDYEVVMPRIKIKNSPPMICYPYKVTLGTFIDALERGAEKLITFNSRGQCRFKHYFDVQKQTLKEMGYEFEMIELNINIPGFFKKLNPNISYLKAIKLMRKYYKKILEIEEKCYKFERKEINIGIVGEIYTILEQKINYDMINKLKRLNVGVHISTKLSNFIKHYLRLEKSKEEKESYNYLKQKIGGDARSSISNTLYYAKNNFDAIIHLMPLTCAPESLIEPIINRICEKNKISLLRFPIDNDFFETGMDMRLKSLISRIKRKKIKEKLSLKIKEKGYFLALDSGSVALKGILMDTNKKIIKSVYNRHTNLLIALKEVLKELKTNVKILGTGVTGTGKEFISKIIGVDVLEEEIECQYASAIYSFPNCKTVIDVGGQDSKLILEDSCDFNESCGSGTGAVIEYIASELNVKIEDVGDIALKYKTLFPFSGTCGVFARRSVIQRKNMGVAKEDILWGVHRALVDNYWTTLVKDRELKGDFVFQGATAKNKALTKCFEEKLKAKLNIPPQPHLSGALGCALITMQNFTGKKTKFKGFNTLIKANIKVDSYIAKGCGNMCEITQIYEDNKLIDHIGNRCERCVTPTN